MFKIVPHSDQKILNAVRDNNPAGWELLFTQYDPMIKDITKWPKWRFSEDEQKDVCQNTHMHLQSALPKFKQQSSLSWFIKRIAIRQCIDEIRRQKRWRAVMTPTVQQKANGDWNEMEFANPDEPDPYDDVVRSERRQLLYAALQSLNKTCRDGISMFYLQNLTYREMAERLDISINTVGSRLAKCLDKMHRELKKQPLFERIDQ